MPQEAAAMTAIVLPDIDRSTIDELKKRFPDLSEIELRLPSRKEVSKTAKDAGRTAEETIDKLLGRKRAPVWPWIAAGIGLMAVIGAVGAWFAWFRRPTWESQGEPESQSEPWTAATYETEQTTMTIPTEPSEVISSEARPTISGARGSRSTVAGPSTAEPVGSAPYPIEEA
jgi:hypothetical protein